MTYLFAFKYTILDIANYNEELNIKKCLKTCNILNSNDKN